MVSNYAKAECTRLPQQGSHRTEQKGTLVLTFDNSYSWTTSKTLLYYTVEVRMHVSSCLLLHTCVHSSWNARNSLIALSLFALM